MPRLIKKKASIPPQVFDEPWREVKWSNDYKNEMLQKVKNFQLRTKDVNQLRILLHGPVGSGKSSFINSFESVLRGYMTAGALTNSRSDGSFTVKFKFYTMKKDGPGSFYPFVFADTMGVEEGSKSGIHTDDINQILLGHIKEGYTFNAVRPISTEDKDYNDDPSLTDKIHCLVYVLSANSISLMSAEVIWKMKTVRQKACDLDIPQVVIMTTVDEACPLVQKDLTKVYTSKKIKEKMQECSNRLGVPMNLIFPVQNYHEKITNDENMDVLLLMAVQNIINFANDHVEDHADAKCCVTKEEE